MKEGKTTTMMGPAQMISGKNIEKEHNKGCFKLRGQLGKAFDPECQAHERCLK